MTTAVFRHNNNDERLGCFAPVLDRRGVEWRFVDCFDEDISGFDPLAPELLIVTGGSPGVYQADTYPFLKQEMKVLEKRLARDLPTFCICLGSQLMAAVLGAKVYQGDQGIERGWKEIFVTEAGMKTPLRHLDARLTRMAQWHVDTFDLPSGAIHLARSAQYENQAFSWGKNAMAVQFHPEITPRIMNSSLVDAAYAAAKGQIDIESLRAETQRHGATAVRQAQLFFDEWLDSVGVGQQQEKRCA